MGKNKMSYEIDLVKKFILYAEAEGHHFSLPVSNRHSDRWIDCDGALRFLQDIPINTSRRIIRSLLNITNERVIIIPVKQDPLHVSFSSIIEDALCWESPDVEALQQPSVYILTAFDTVSGEGLRNAENKLNDKYPHSEIRVLIAFNLSPKINPTKSKAVSFVYSPAKIWSADNCQMCCERVPLFHE